MRLRYKPTGLAISGYIQTRTYGKYEVVNENNLDESYEYDTLAALNEEWEDYKPAEPQIEDEMAREIIKKWYNKNKIVGKLCSYGGERWLGLRGSDKDGCDWKIELHVRYDSMLKDDELYSLTELIGEEE